VKLRASTRWPSHRVGGPHSCRALEVVKARAADDVKQNRVRLRRSYAGRYRRYRGGCCNVIRNFTKSDVLSIPPFIAGCRAAAALSVPRELWDAGIRRYRRSRISLRILQLWERKYRALVTAHLGTAARLDAVLNGNPMTPDWDSSPDGGLMMGTRARRFDPGVIVYARARSAYDAKDSPNS